MQGVAMNPKVSKSGPEKIDMKKIIGGGSHSTIHTVRENIDMKWLDFKFYK